MYMTVCTVDAVDEEARTIDCTPIDEGAQLIGVNLQADQNRQVGIVSIPAVGSDVVVGYISPAVAVVVLTTDITKTMLTIGDVKAEISGDKFRIDANGNSLEINGDEVIWNGGRETTANATELRQELEKMSARIDGIIQAIRTSAVGSADGGTLYKTNMSAMVSALDREDFSGMIDERIKH